MERMTENELLNELTIAYGYREKKSDEVSVSDFMKATGLSQSRCTDILNKKVESGELVKERIKGENKMPIWVYRKPTGKR